VELAALANRMANPMANPVAHPAVPAFEYCNPTSTHTAVASGLYCVRLIGFLSKN